nr:DNA-processing protein DprA [uncultured Dorea sp.]
MIYEYWLAGIKEISDRKKRILRETYRSGKAIYYIEETALRPSEGISEKDIEILLKAKRKKDLKDKWKKLDEKHIQFIPYYVPEYPEKLKNIQDPPYALYVLGKLPENNQKAVAIVGARRCTPYGEQMALEYGNILARAGIPVISGMARGIDGAGQRGALNGGGETYAVLGCGVDICYPRENIGLYMDIQKNGGIISEFPPGTEPLSWNFPRRNRIISGLSDWILVMEAKEKSGSLITADMGLEQGKDVYALPGPVTSVLSQGCHRLIRQGAGILLTPEELIEEWNIKVVRYGQKSDKNEKMLESPEVMVYSCLDLFPKGIEQLLNETNLSGQELMERLITLELKGYAKEVSRNYYIKAR